MGQSQKFFQVALETCRAAGRRAILATKFPSQLPAVLPPEVFHASYAPFSLLLPRCAGIVHHGGIGTTSQALAAGAPQLIQPFSHDQPDNAARVRRLGCGDVIWPCEFTPNALARKLEALIDAPAVRARCAAVAERLRAEDAAARLLDTLAPWLAI
jgi:UDP:flavonoid glycosyltransferase YjiC (YdhE family)